MLTFEVRINEIRQRAGRRKPFELRWTVGPQRHSKSFATKTLAQGREAELRTAMKKGEQFDVESGLPASELRAIQKAKQQVTWYQHARKYAEMKWARSSAKSRGTRADALATITPALVTDRKGAPAPRVLRRALTGWAFNFSERLPEPPEQVAAALEWIERKSVPMGLLEEDADLMRSGLTALTLMLNGKEAAANTVRRKRMVLNNCLRYGVERRQLAANPLQFIDWDPPETDDEVDWRYVPNPTQAKELIATAPTVGPRGRHLTAFFACMYYAGMRPAEVTDLRKRNCTLPESGWGSLLLAGSSPNVGSIWTNDGTTHDERGLKRRARKATRDVPIPPVLVAMLREHLTTYGTGAGGRVFKAAEGGRVLSKEYAAVWKKIRDAWWQAQVPERVNGPHAVDSPEPDLDERLAEVPYALRKAGITLWLVSGVDPTEVARRAGHSVAVLYRFYAKVLDGKRDEANEKIERALNESAGTSDAPSE
ncbi:site-specific integrase [Streptomyces tateyamensis]|uniref:Site-specific integrase n=1 Tax=Streptomyces tateyamensis TaxID=565073 RepID=A0A2V4NAS2_9ACTN|nr:site-specific integrase [Streptomyces tateyamensis]PYC80480.1 site-specific integrase [Streptomyces tateyamensis]